KAELRVVVVVSERGVPGRWRLRMVAEELGADGPPPLPAGLRFGRAHLRVQLKDPPLPVEQLQLGDHATAADSVVLRSGTSRRNHVRRNAMPETTAPTRNIGCSAFE